MGRYSNKDVKKPRDWWPTIDPDAVKPLLPFIAGKRFVEPCAGDGSLIDLIEPTASCAWASDLEPQSEDIIQLDVAELSVFHTGVLPLIITNPPYSWEMLQPIAEKLIALGNTWLLLPSSIMFNKRSSSLIERSLKILTVGRLFWVLDGDESFRGQKGKEDFVWIYWPRGGNRSSPTEFIPK